MKLHRWVFVVLVVGTALASTGCDGDDGVETDIFTVSDTFSLNHTDVAFTDFVANIRYAISAIGADVVANGAVLVFIEDLHGTWTALPYTYGIEATDQPVVDYTVSIGYAFDTGFVDVFVEASSSDDVVWEEILDDALLGTTRRIRFVIFNTFVRGKTQVDVTDYEALRRHYGLPE